MRYSVNVCIDLCLIMHACMHIPSVYFGGQFVFLEVELGLDLTSLSFVTRLKQLVQICLVPFPLLVLFFFCALIIQTQSDF